MKTFVVICVLGCLGIVSATAVEDDKPDIEVEAGEWDSYCDTNFPEMRDSQNYTDGIIVYSLFRSSLNFTDAEIFCRRRYRNGHLASIHSYRTNRILTCLTSHNSRVKRAWLGAYELFSSAKYVWSDGTKWNYANWVRGWPRRYSQSCVEINWKRVGQWSDHSCSVRKQFVCEHRH
ncbi:LECA protein, partial [Amia calva]|nr:LECA protein [Amia calva]